METGVRGNGNNHMMVKDSQQCLQRKRVKRCLACRRQDSVTVDDVVVTSQPVIVCMCVLERRGCLQPIRLLGITTILLSIRKRAGNYYSRRQEFGYITYVCFRCVTHEISLSRSSKRVMSKCGLKNEKSQAISLNSQFYFPEITRNT